MITIKEQRIPKLTLGIDWIFVSTVFPVSFFSRHSHSSLSFRKFFSIKNATSSSSIDLLCKSCWCPHTSRRLGDLKERVWLEAVSGHSSWSQRLELSWAERNTEQLERTRSGMCRGSPYRFECDRALWNVPGTHSHTICGRAEGGCSHRRVWQADSE